jgi:hypothetical protein
MSNYVQLQEVNPRWAGIATERKGENVRVSAKRRQHIGKQG